MFGVVLACAMIAQSPEKAWHLGNDGQYHFGYVHDGNIIWEPSEQPKRVCYVRWWIETWPPDYDAAQMEEIIHEAARRWHVAKVKIVKAKDKDEANLIVQSYGPTYQATDGRWYQNMTWVGLTEMGGPDFYYAGNKAILRINTHFRLQRRYLLNTVIHEMGHALGLGHGGKGSVMEPTIEGATELTPEDHQAIVGIYGQADE